MSDKVLALNSQPHFNIIIPGENVFTSRIIIFKKKNVFFLKHVENDEKKLRVNFSQYRNNLREPGEKLVKMSIGVF